MRGWWRRPRSPELLYRVGAASGLVLCGAAIVLLLTGAWIPEGVTLFVPLGLGLLFGTAMAILGVTVRRRELDNIAHRAEAEDALEEVDDGGPA